MIPEELVTVILAIVGVFIQLAVMYIPGFNDWYDNLPNKGVVMLGFNFAAGVLYFGAGCVPVLAEWLKVLLSCDVAGVFTLLNAFFLIALSQQLTYGFLKNTAKNLQAKRQS